MVKILTLCYEVSIILTEVFTNSFMMQTKNIYFLHFILLISLTSAPVFAGNIDIIDGGDVETMKHMFPSLKDRDLSGLARLREQRLANEAKCKPEPESRFITISFRGKFSNSEDANIATAHQSARILKVIKNSGISYSKEYPAHLSIINRGSIVRDSVPANTPIFLAMWDKSYVAKTDEKMFDYIRNSLQDKTIGVHIRTIRRCPDGNTIFGE